MVQIFFCSLSIIYAVFSVANFIAPPIVSAIGPRSSLLCGGLCYWYVLVNTKFFISCIKLIYVRPREPM
ncbi:MAG: UNC93-like protein MFSD11 [Flavobacteriaceae bacterium]|nr:UNC93-like protein MFSD11 [Flavobacteriaceae bacterium]